jgi:peroxiredoxin
MKTKMLKLEARRACALIAWISWMLLASGGASADDTKVAMGQAAPTFSLPALDGGKPISLASHRGDVVYLDFWASWCPPCVTSLPLLDDLRQEFGPRGFQVVAINVDRDTDKARRFLEKRPVGYRSASDPDGVLPERFGIETMPTSFLIDRDGVVRHVHAGFRKSDIEGLRAQIRDLTQSPPAKRDR